MSHRITLLLGAFLGALLPAALATAHADCGPGSHWIDGCTASADLIDTQWTVKLDTGLDGNFDCQTDISLVVSGPIRIQRSAALDASVFFPGVRPVDGHLDVVDIEVTSMALTDGAFVNLVGGAGFGSGGVLSPSLGYVVEHLSDPTAGIGAVAFFAEANAFGTLIYNHDPLILFGAEDKLPSDSSYSSFPGICVAGWTDPVGGTFLGNLVGLSYVVMPPPVPYGAMSDLPCVDGFAGPFACQGIDLQALVPLAEFGAGPANDLWGWTDPNTGTEYVLLGLSEGTAFLDLSVPTAPVYLGLLPTHGGPSPWRDIKVAGDYAFIVSEDPGHGMQIFDLTQLASVSSPPVSFVETAHYPGFGSGHNVAINEDTNVAYVVGSDTCAGSLNMIDIANPLAPVFLGCSLADGYVHDTQCVVYSGPDSAHVGEEICFNASLDALTVVNVTNKTAPVQLSSSPYAESAYTHQGWLSEDQRYFVMGDELDEITFFSNTRTFVWDVIDLDAPVLVGVYTGPSTSGDHNLYIHDDKVFEANWTSGLRVLEIGDLSALGLSETAFFDTLPSNDNAALIGAWSVYPFFDSGTIVVSDMISGLFVLKIPVVTVPGLGVPNLIVVLGIIGAVGLAVLRGRLRGISNS